MIDKRFGIHKLAGEKLIFAAQPTGFIRYHLTMGLLSVVGIPFLPIVWLLARISQDKYRYWLTNKRVILSSGFIGYQVRSIPLERISDVSLSRTFPEMMAGVSSIMVRDMTGETDSGKSMLAIPTTNEYQRQILDAVQAVNTEPAVV